MTLVIHIGIEIADTEANRGRFGVLVAAVSGEVDRIFPRGSATLGWHWTEQPAEPGGDCQAVAKLLEREPKPKPDGGA